MPPRRKRRHYGGNRAAELTPEGHAAVEKILYMPVSASMLVYTSKMVKSRTIPFSRAGKLLRDRLQRVIHYKTNDLYAVCVAVKSSRGPTRG